MRGERFLARDGHRNPPTQRQLEVLAAVAQHRSYQDASKALGISMATVKGHLADLTFRLRAHTLYEALAKVGWLRIPAHLRASPPAPVRMLTTGQAARVLGVHPNTLVRLADSGDVPYRRVSRRGDRRFLLADLLALDIGGEGALTAGYHGHARARGAA